VNNDPAVTAKTGALTGDVGVAQHPPVKKVVPQVKLESGPVPGVIPTPEFFNDAGAPAIKVDGTPSAMLEFRCPKEAKKTHFYRVEFQKFYNHTLAATQEKNYGDEERIWDVNHFAWWDSTGMVEKPAYQTYNETSVLLSYTQLQRLAGKLVSFKLDGSTQFPAVDPADATVATGNRPAYPTYDAESYPFFSAGHQFRVRIRVENTHSPGLWSEYSTLRDGHGFMLNAPQQTVSNLTRNVTTGLKRLVSFEDFEFNAVAKFWTVRLAWQGVTNQSLTGGDDLNQIRYEIFRESDPTKISDDYHKLDFEEYRASYTKRPSEDSSERPMAQHVATVGPDFHFEDNGDIEGGQMYHYRVWVRNRGVFRAQGSAEISLKAMGCPLMPYAMVDNAAVRYQNEIQLVKAYGNAIHLKWMDVASSTEKAKTVGFDADANVMYKLYVFVPKSHETNTAGWLEGVGVNLQTTTSYTTVRGRQSEMYLLLAELPLTTTSFNHTGLLKSVEYTYRLSLKNSLCEGMMQKPTGLNSLGYGRIPDVLGEPDIESAGAAPLHLNFQWKLYEEVHGLAAERQKWYYWPEVDTTLFRLRFTKMTAVGGAPEAAEVVLPYTSTLLEYSSRTLSTHGKSLFGASSSDGHIHEQLLGSNDRIQSVLRREFDGELVPKDAAAAFEATREFKPIVMRVKVTPELFATAGVNVASDYFSEAHQYMMVVRHENKFGAGAWSEPSSVSVGSGFTLDAPTAVTNVRRNPIEMPPQPNAIKFVFDWGEGTSSGDDSSSSIGSGLPRSLAVVSEGEKAD
jgi:hypothetical protein